MSQRQDSKSSKQRSSTRTHRSAYQPGLTADLFASNTSARSRRPLKITDVGQMHGLYLSLLFAVMTAFGLIVLLSASSVSAHYESGDSLQLFRKQFVWACLGGVAFFVASRVDYRLLRKFVPLMLLSSFALMGLVLVPGVGVNLNGSSRWLSLGPVVIQPAEIGKFALIVFIAHLLTLRERRMDKPELTVRPVMLVFGIYAVLFALQPKLGSIIVLGTVVVVLLFVGGAQLRSVFSWVGAGVVAFAFAVLTSDHAMRRIDAFLNPMDHLNDIAWQPVQSQIAAASGGITGVGIGAGRIKYGFLPEVESDFIFANLAEETGLIGSCAVISFYLLIAWFGLRAAMNAPDRFGMLLATGLTTMIVTQAFLNIGVVLGVFPVTGVPLPFVSAGGSSLVMTLVAAGLLTNVAKRARVA